jgi:hypothetical protein
MRTLMKEEEKRQREHDAAIEVLRRYIYLSMTASNILCNIMVSIFCVCRFYLQFCDNVLLYLQAKG